MINRKAIGYITANYSSTYGSVLLKDRPIASVRFGPLPPDRLSAVQHDECRH